MSEQKFVSWLSDWYQTKTAAVLRELAPERAKEFEQDLLRITSQSQVVDAPATICVIGKSGVGKSTLINALVGGSATVVPAGGVGPLTAHALQIRYGERKRLEVQYHGPQSVWQLVFALQKMFPDDVKAIDLTANERELASNDDEDFKSLETTQPTADPTAEQVDALKERLHRAAAYRATAQLLIAGDQSQELPIPHLVDALFVALGKAPPHGSVIPADHQSNIEAIRKALRLRKEIASHIVTDEDPTQFQAELNRHAAGNLSPMLSGFLLEWPSDLLKSGLQFVDLPGTGIAGDTFKEAARNWMTAHARAVLMVVDHRGVDESVAQMLHATNFLTSLLYYSAESPEARPILIAAVSKLDDIAKSERSKLPREQRLPMLHYFTQAAERAQNEVRAGIRKQLIHAAGATGTPIADEVGSTSSAKASAIDELIKTLRVYPVSAPDYRDLLSGDEEMTPTLKLKEDTNVPAFQSFLEEFAIQYRNENRKQLDIAARAFLERVLTTLTVLKERWSGDSRADETARELGEKLSVFLEPRRADFHRRQGQMKEFLDNSMPQKIDALVDLAAHCSSEEIRTYLRQSLRGVHWATLRASVRRGGRYRGINLPGELARKFEEPIAELWGKNILDPIRKEINIYAKWCAEVVESISEWCNSQNIKVRSTLVLAQANEIKADAKNLSSIGSAVMRELRDEVKSSLSAAIEPPITKACRRFVDNDRDIGLGVMNRILELYDDLARESTQTASPAAKKLLRLAYSKVRTEIDGALKSTSDPITRAASAIVESQESLIRRQDAQRRQRLLGLLDTAINASESVVAEIQTPMQSQS
jgi:GTP-binding protein EngB required for normal cell division